MNNQLDGFQLTNLNNPTVTIPVYITPHVSGTLTNYYLEA